MAGISEFTHDFFQGSSDAWKMNKVRYGQAMYKYKAKAFEKDPEEPKAPKVSKLNHKECLQRQQIDEVAPPRRKRSDRLRQKEIQAIYSSSGDCADGSHLQE
jgi:hypothetical protein